MGLYLVVALISLSLGCALTAWHLEAVKKAAWAERQKAEHWRRQYEWLRNLNEQAAPAPMQLNVGPVRVDGLDAEQWAKHGAILKTKIGGRG